MTHSLQDIDEPDSVQDIGGDLQTAHTASRNSLFAWVHPDLQRMVLLLGPLHTGSRLGSLRPTLPALRGPRSSLRASRLFDLPARARTLSDSDASHATLHAPRLGPIFCCLTRLPLPLPHSCSDHGPFTLHATVPSSLTGLTRPAWTGLPGRVSFGLAHSLPGPAASPRPLHSGRL